MEEIFLSELIEYGNSTLSRDIQLNIPANNTYSEWEGLTSNSKYKINNSSIKRLHFSLYILK